MAKNVETAKERRLKFLAEHGDKVMVKYREVGSAVKVEKALKCRRSSSSISCTSRAASVGGRDDLKAAADRKAAKFMRVLVNRKKDEAREEEESKYDKDDDEGDRGD